MPNRAARRAAARHAVKLAGKAGQSIHAVADPQPPASELFANAFDFADEEDDALSIGNEKTFAAAAASTNSEPEPEAAPISDARLAANRANSQHSTGPKTASGKAKSSLNAVKTGLTGQTVLLPTDDALAYRQHIDRHFAQYAPATDEEHTLVQSILDTEWRLLRIAPLEAAILCLGLRELAEEFAEEENPATRSALLSARIAIHYRRDLSNFALQERRLRNHREKDIAQLQALQKARLDKRKSEIGICVKQGRDFNPADCGFDFSIGELHYYLDRTATQFRLTQTRPDFDPFVAAYRLAHKEAKAA